MYISNVYIVNYLPSIATGIELDQSDLTRLYNTSNSTFVF
jgi:hypothetical protein